MEYALLLTPTSTPQQPPKTKKNVSTTHTASNDSATSGQNNQTNTSPQSKNTTPNTDIDAELQLYREVILEII